MKVACIFITLNRLDLTLRCIKQNFFNSQYNADVIWMDNGSDPAFIEAVKPAFGWYGKLHMNRNIGVAGILNEGIKLAKARNYDAIVTLANDILMPQGWLKAMVEAAERIPNTGMAGIHCVEAMPPVNELGVCPIFTAFGNVLIPMKAIDTIGVFNTAYDPYGTQDADFAYRLNATGFINYYLPNLRSEHIGHDVGDGSAYRAMKDESLNKAGQLYSDFTTQYDATKNYYVGY